MASKEAAEGKRRNLQTQESGVCVIHVGLRFEEGAEGRGQRADLGPALLPLVGGLRGEQKD